MRIVPGASAVVAILAIVGCASWHPVKEPNVTMTHLQAEDVGVFEQQLDLRLRIRNPNEFPLEVQGIRFDMKIGGKPVADGYDNKRFTVPAQGEHEVDVTARSQSVAMLHQLMKVGDDFSYEVGGKLLLGNKQAAEVAFDHETRVGFD
jgi:LEA14-like dessication related protein